MPTQGHDPRSGPRINHGPRRILRGKQLIRLGIIGAGAVAPLHAQAATTLPDVELVAVCDLRPDTASDVAVLTGAAVYTDYLKMYAEAELDAVIVNTPHALHLQMVLDAADAGLHVLVEKPMAISLADCDVMMRACEQAGVTLVVGHIQHFLPEKVAAHEALASGKLGKLLMIRDFRSTNYRPGTRPAWFFDPVMAGGGAFMNIGGHCIDRSLWLADSAAETVDSRTLARFGVEVETDGYLNLHLRNGVEINIVIVSDPPQRLDEILLICEEGTISCTPDRGTIIRHHGQSSTLHVPSADNIQTGFTDQLADFLATVNGASPQVSNNHARSIVETILAAYRSATSRKTEPVRAETVADLQQAL